MTNMAPNQKELQQSEVFLLKGFFYLVNYSLLSFRVFLILLSQFPVSKNNLNIPGSESNYLAECAYFVHLEVPMELGVSATASLKAHAS